MCAAVAYVRAASARFLIFTISGRVRAFASAIRTRSRFARVFTLDIAAPLPSTSENSTGLCKGPEGAVRGNPRGYVVLTEGRDACQAWGFLLDYYRALTQARLPLYELAPAPACLETLR